MIEQMDGTMYYIEHYLYLNEFICNTMYSYASVNYGPYHKQSPKVNCPTNLRSQCPTNLRNQLT